MSEKLSAVRMIGRYQVLGEAGRGAMGVVYKGYDPTIGRTVALKTIALGTMDAQAQEFRRRLYREASAAGALAHPNIVTVYDVIEDGNTTAVAMEFVEGQTVASIVAARGPLPLDEALGLFEQICAALDYAGGKGIIHRDIKPANIMVGLDGRPKVTDFGIARLPTSNMTQTGMALGSPSYMSPEQVKGLRLDRRSDLFSAATLLYEMITKERAFGGTDTATTMYRIVHDRPTPAHHLNPSLGPGVTAVLDHALAKDPAHRYGTGAELAWALRTAAGQIGQSSAARPLSALVPAQPGLMPAFSAGPVPARPLLHRIGLSVGILGLVLSTGALVVMLVRGSGPMRTANPTPSPPVPQPSSLPPNAPTGSAVAQVVGSPAPAVTPESARAPAAPRPARTTIARTSAEPDVSLEVDESSAPQPAPAPPAPTVSPAPATGSPTLRSPASSAGVPSSTAAPALRSPASSAGVPSSSTSALKSPASSAGVPTSSSNPASARPGVPEPVGGLASAVIDVRGDATNAYAGLSIFVDERLVPGPYPAQLPRLAAGIHTVRLAWTSGLYAGKDLKQSFEAKTGGHFLIRAIPETEQVVVQQVR